MKKRTLKQPPTALVIDDTEVDRYIARAFIRRVAPLMQVQACGDAREALAWLQRRRQGDFPALIVLDMKLPMHSGRFFLQRLVEMPGFSPHRCRILPVSAYTEFNSPEKSRQLQTDFPFLPECAPKPLCESLIRQTIGSCREN